MINLISKAKTELILLQPFFATLLYDQELIEDPSVETMVTNGEWIRYSPDFVNSLTLQELVFVLAHEVMHSAFSHCLRLEGRDPMTWNIATDYVINGILKAEKVGIMPKMGLLNDALVTKGGGTAEGVYRLLEEEKQKNQKKQKQNGGKKSNNSGDQGGNSSKGKKKVKKGPKSTGQCPGDSKDTDSNSGLEGHGKPLEKLVNTVRDQATKSLKEAENIIRIKKAQLAAAGRMSAGLKRLAAEATRQPSNWRQILRNLMTEKIKEVYSFARPRRKSLDSEFILPSLSGEGMARVVVAIDCSGSVSDDILGIFSSEIKGIIEDLSPSQVDILYFDSKVLDVKEFPRGEEVKIEPKGGGGTAFSPIFKKLQSGEVPQVVVVLTDLQCADFGPAPEYPVIWASVCEGMAPFGEVIKLELDK